MASLPRVTAVPDPSDYAAVAAFMRPRIRPFVEGKEWVHLIDPTQTVTSLNKAQGTQTVTVTPVWSGWARIQPLRNTVSTWRASNPTTTRIVQFWVDDPETLQLDFRPGLRFAVDDVVTANDPAHSLYLYVILGGINSSQAWQRTIDTQVDLENRPNFDMAAWPKPPEA